MLQNDVADSFLPSVFTSQLHSILDMGNEDEARHRRGEMFVFIFCPPRVLDEVERFFQFPDVMIISADPGQQRVGRNRFCSRLDEASNNDAVVIGTGSLKNQVLLGWDGPCWPVQAA